MGFELKNVIPWGRSFEEYCEMFDLKEKDLHCSIIGCGDGPAGFNKTMHEKGFQVVSCDPIYIFSKQQIEQRIHEAKAEVMKQMYDNMDLFVWDKVKSPDELLERRLATMNAFLIDYEIGKEEGRYVPHSLPLLPFEDIKFDLALSSHLLFFFPKLGYDFHLKSIYEMLRIAHEIRIFPTIDMNTHESEFLIPIINDLDEKKYFIEIIKVNYEFHKGGNKLLRIVGRE